MRRGSENREAGAEQRGSVRTIVLLFVVVAAVALLLVAVKGWKIIYQRYFEKFPPQIVFDEQQPRGIGVSPVSLAFTVSDVGTGLDEVIVRVHQRSGSREILRRSFKGDHEAEVSIDFPGEKSMLDEGPLRLEIKVFDRSFWSNSAEKTVELTVDLRRPRVEPVTVMHNARRGGTQLVVFRAIDAHLALCGVKVGNQIFRAIPARELDPAITSPDIYAALYAIDIRTIGAPLTPRIFAQDVVGNASSVEFPNRILPRQERTQVVTLSDEFLWSTVDLLIKSNFKRIQDFAAEMGKSVEYLSPPETAERGVESFKLANELLRSLSEQKLAGLLKRAGKVPPQLSGAFLQQNGAVNSSFGDLLSYRYDKEVIGTTRQVGFDILMPRGSTVMAAADGTVIFTETLGTYGEVVGIDHGMGLVSVYGRLEAAGVVPGVKVKAGQAIGVSGQTGLARANQVYFELRVHGVPVDPREWWDQSWFEGHIRDQIATAKKLLEIPLPKADSAAGRGL